MTKGEAYRAYYLKNRERILAANRERGAAYRAKLREENNPDAVAARREKMRAAYHRRRANYVKETFLGRAKDVDEEWRPFFERLATIPNLENVGNKTLQFLMTAGAAAQS